MLVLLQVLESPAPKRKIQLRQRQRAVIGRTNHSDFSLPEDTALEQRHFEIDCTGKECKLRSLVPQGTRVNGKIVQEITLCDTDIIAAGRTRFTVTMEGSTMTPETPQSTDAQNAAPEAAAAMSLVAVCTYLELEPEAIQAAEQAADREDLIRQCLAADDVNSAFRLRADALGNRAAVWWACLSVRKYQDKLALPENQVQAIQAAEAWVIHSTEAARVESSQAAEATGPDGVGGLIAWATFCSGGDIGHPDAGPVEPAPTLCGKLLAGVLMVIAYQVASLAQQRIQEMLALALALQTEQLQIPEPAENA